MLGLLMCAFNVLGESTSSAQHPDEHELAAMQTAQVLGAQAFRHDRAAWLATDALRELRSFKRDRRVQGWITQSREGAIQVTVIGGSTDEPVALYRATISDSGSVVGTPETLKSPEPLDAFERAAARARAKAFASNFTPCSKTYNSIVLPVDHSIDQWIVYLFPGTTKRNVVPIGGSYRLDVDLANDSAELRAYTRSCIELQNDPGAVGLMITHLMDPVPTDAHVFWSLWAGKALYVGTTPSGSFWAIENGQIRLVQRKGRD